MATDDTQEQAAAIQESIDHFHTALQDGTEWYEALLEAVALWPVAEEHLEGRRYQYLIASEAFDWLLLAERLALSANGRIPQESLDRLLFHGIPPRPLSDDQFKHLVGDAKYRALRNYWYGITVEEALVLAVEHEVRKQRRGYGSGYGSEERNLEETVHQRVYGQTRSNLLDEFHAELSRPPSDTASLTDLKEFTYWLFKHRVKHSEPAKMASDTRKALDFLQQLGRRSPH